MAKFCYNCGSKLDDDACFCAECGTVAVQQPPVAQSAPVVQPAPFTQSPPAVMAGASGGNIYSDIISAEQRNGLNKWHSRASVSVALCVIAYIIGVVCAYQFKREDIIKGYPFISSTEEMLYEKFQTYSDIRMWLTIASGAIFTVAVILLIVSLCIRLKTILTKTQADFAMRMSEYSIVFSCIASGFITIFDMLILSGTDVYPHFIIPWIIYVICLMISVVIGIGLSIYRRKFKAM